MSEEPSTALGPHTDSNASKPKLSELEQKAGEIFGRLYDYLILWDGYTTLNGFSSARTCYPDRGFVLETQNNRYNESFIRFGFTNEQINQGVTVIDRYEMVIKDPNDPFRGFRKGRNVKTTYIAKIGEDKVKVVDVVDSQPIERQLDSNELSSLAASDGLMNIVKEISDQYTDVSHFRACIKKASPAVNIYSGIENPDVSGKMLFNGGLTLFVKEYRLFKLGTPPDDATGKRIRL